MTWNQRQTVHLSVVFQLRPIDKRSVSRLSTIFINPQSIRLQHYITLPYGGGKESTGLPRFASISAGPVRSHIECLSRGKGALTITCIFLPLSLAYSGCMGILPSTRGLTSWNRKGNLYKPLPEHWSLASTSSIRPGSISPSVRMVT